MTFAHVESDFLRAYLSAPVKTLTTADHKRAYAETMDSAESDLRACESGIDYGLSSAVMDSRFDAVDAMTEAMTANNYAAAHTAAVSFWLV